MYKRYSYVGSDGQAAQSGDSTGRMLVDTKENLLHWMLAAEPLRRMKWGEVTVTMIVDLEGRLWIADQHSEHVACAGGRDVLAAGEMTFSVSGDGVSVSEVSNQSTGYCPEPESWWAVDAALTRLGISHPAIFTSVFVFRRCEVCGMTNVVKDGWFECAVCQAPLSRGWNFG
ncbi:MAG: hypothetical protein ACJ78Q_13935 [Chloroflexia bacterium]